MQSMQSAHLVSLVTTPLWTLMSIALAVVFIVKYKASATGILGALGAIGLSLIAVSRLILPAVVSTWGGIRVIELAFALLNMLSLLANGCILVAIILAPGLRREPWTPPPTPQG